MRSMLPDIHSIRYTRFAVRAQQDLLFFSHNVPDNHWSRFRLDRILSKVEYRISQICRLTNPIPSYSIIDRERLWPETRQVGAP